MLEGDIALVGFDLKKDPETLVPAYRDSQGVTAAFNLNLLERMNRELGANFDLDAFVHHPIYNPHIGAMESFLLSKKAQTVHFPRVERTVSFEAWESIHTECSYKFSRSQIRRFRDESGFKAKDELIDDRGFFMDAIWSV
jgi:uncharacterized SAM-dependent methyltransferase